MWCWVYIVVNALLAALSATAGLFSLACGVAKIHDRVVFGASVRLFIPGAIVQTVVGIGLVGCGVWVSRCLPFIDLVPSCLG
jgi:hypothetical protein